MRIDAITEGAELTAVIQPVGDYAPVQLAYTVSSELRDVSETWAVVGDRRVAEVDLLNEFGDWPRVTAQIVHDGVTVFRVQATLEVDGFRQVTEFRRPRITG